MPNSRREKRFNQCTVIKEAREKIIRLPRAHFCRSHNPVRDPNKLLPMTTSGHPSAPMLASPGRRSTQRR
jgi:hypothetical protein